MKIVAEVRGGGKTTALIKLAHEVGGIIVCPTSRDADNAAMLAYKMGMKIKTPITFDELRRGVLQGASTKQRLLLDDVDRILEHLVPDAQVVAASLTVCKEGMEG